MPEYPVGSSEELLAAVAAAGPLLDSLAKSKELVESYKATIAQYQSKVAEELVKCDSIMKDLADVSDEYVKIYLGYDPNTQTG